jgi:hypothetical protein
MFAVAVIFALVDVAFWAKGWKPLPTGLWLIIPYALAVSIVEYLAVTGIAGVAPSTKAYVRFACTSTLMLLPLLAAIAILFAAPIIGRTVALVACGAGVVAGSVIVAFLFAWPVAQAFSPSIVAPLKVFRATQGFRWGLVGAALLLSAFNGHDLLPEVDRATNLSEAFAYAAGEAGISTLSMMYTAAVAVTAFIFACRNNEDLYPPRNPTGASASNSAWRMSESVSRP